MLFKFNQTKISNPRISHKGHNREHPDITISKEGLEYDTSLPTIKGLYYSERLREAHSIHETLKQYDSELDKDANYKEAVPVNPALHAQKAVKIQRHRMLLPSIFY